MKKVCSLLLPLLLPVLLYGIFLLILACARPAQILPDSGVWYCEELDITLNFDKGIGSVPYGGLQMKGIIENDRGSDVFSVLNQDWENQHFFLGESMFAGTCIRFDEETMEVQKFRSEERYVFYIVK